MNTMVALIRKTVIFALLAYALIFSIYIFNHLVWLKKLPQPQEMAGKMALAWLQLKTPSYRNLQDVALGKISPERIRTYLAYYNQMLPHALAKADVYHIMGYCHYYLQEYDRAREFYQKAYKSHRRIFWFAYNLGVIFLREGQYQKAKESFQTAQKVKPKFSLSFMTETMRAYPATALDRIINIDELSNQLLAGLAQNAQGLMLSHYYLKEYGDMMRLASQVSQTQLANKDIFDFYMGVAFYQLGKYHHALKYFNRFIKTTPEAPEGYHYLGWTLDKLGDKKDAGIFFKEAKEMQKKYPPTLLDPEDLQIGFF